MEIPRKKTIQTKTKKTKLSRSGQFFRRATFILGSALFLCVAFYSLAVAILNPRFFLSDVREKAGIVKGVTTVSVRVIDVPEQPVVTAAPGCSGSNPYVALSWAETLDTDTYDIARDGLPLVAGLSSESYQDNSVDLAADYGYQIIAVGPRGETTSDPVSATTTADCIAPDSFIISIGGVDVSQTDGTPRFSEHQPEFTGTTNIPNALIDIEIHSSLIHASTVANSNGYWSWTLAVKLAEGLHTITVTATDPNDPARTATAQRTFKIVSADEEEEEKKKKAPTPFAQPLQPIQPTIPPQPRIDFPFSLAVEILNDQGIAYAGQELLTQAIVIPENDLFGSKNATLKYQILDERQNILAEAEEKIEIDGREQIAKNIFIPELVKNGKYKLRVQMSLDSFLFTAEAPFAVRESPLFTVGSTEITWSWILLRLSWIILWLLLLLILFLILLALEHHKSTKALFHITEDMLARRGQISRRKGVAR